MNRQIVRIGSTIVNFANVTHAELDFPPDMHPRYKHDHDEDSDLQVVVLYLNDATNAGGHPMQRNITFDGEEAELLRKYFDHAACVLQKRSANHASD
jgi:hypothetical protein